MAKNIAKTARRQLRGQHLLFGFAELDKPKHKLNIDAGKLVLAMFLN